MAKITQVVLKSGSKTEVLRPSKGFEIKQVGKKLTLMRQSDGLGIATISCGCRGSGSCGVVIDTKGRATCEGGCSGGCNWVIKSIGLTQAVAIG